MLELIFDELKTNLQQAIEFFQGNVSRVRTGRASATLVEGIKVDYYGSSTPIKNLANIATPDARTLTIQPWDASVIPEVEKAILKSDLGITPQNDGKLLRLVVPNLTEDRRKELVKSVSKMGEENKVSLRQFRRESMDQLKTLEKDKEISEDDRRRAEPKIQSILDDFVSKVDDIVTSKEKEIMEI